MRKLPNKQIAGRRRSRGIKKNKNSSPSSHIFINERWLISHSMPNGETKQMAFLTEKKAMAVGTAIALNMGFNVEMDHQTMNEAGEWVS